MSKRLSRTILVLATAAGLAASAGTASASPSSSASRGDHAPGETVDIPSISRQAKRAAILMTRLSRERP